MALKISENKMPINLNYLTTQDIIWINLQVTNKVNLFEYSGLEEAANCQYGYHNSASIYKQALTFIHTFIKNAPFAEGNQATALIAFMAFLKFNGHTLNIPDKKAKDYFETIKAGKIDANTLSYQCVDEEPKTKLEPLIEELVKTYKGTIKNLNKTN